jgi:dTDP-4-amino-4,6-dideoxygalactose transaminase/GT2 family glycosyltransferase
MSDIAIVVLTHNREQLLRQCIENVVLRTSDATKEVVVWNNGSTDGTAEYLASLTDPRIRVVNSDENIGMNAYARGFAMTSADHLIDLDDDMIDAPPEWDRRLLESFERLPQVGFLAANLVDNPYDKTAQVMYHRDAHLYSVETVNGVTLKVGPTGGGCAITSRELYDRVGGFRQREDQVFWLEDAAFIQEIMKLGLQAAYLNDLQVLHAGGVHYSPIPEAKQEYWWGVQQHIERKDAVKRALLAIPGVRPMNERRGWFQPPRSVKGAAPDALKPVATMEAPAAEQVDGVPFLDLRPSHAPIRDELLEEIAELVDSGFYSNGPQVAAFEEAFAAYCGTSQCVGMGSGLDALRLGLIAAGLDPGEEVIVPAMTFVATLEAVTQAGGRPVVVDIREDDYGLDPAAADAAVTPATRYLMPVHLYGQLVDLRALTEVADRSGVAIVEDACQAHSAQRDGVPVGSVGVFSAFSFYPGKNLGAMGDAGALVTNDGSLADTARALREHGQRSHYRHDIEGYTSRLDTIQAIVLGKKLPLLDGWNVQRSEAARFYGEALAGVGDIGLPPVPPNSTHVWHRYVIRTEDPGRLAGFLRERGVGTVRNYPEPVHLAPAYAGLGYREGDFPVAEALAREALSIPLYPGIGEAQLEYVVEAIRAYFSG